MNSPVVKMNPVVSVAFDSDEVQLPCSSRWRRCYLTSSNGGGVQADDSRWSRSLAFGYPRGRDEEPAEF